jgi:CheY-like chemotaxis protein
MANILILQEHAGSMQALRKSLGEHHRLHFVSDVPAAMKFLNNSQIDLIIARVHLEEGNVFEFIRAIKENIKLKNIPLVCFCGSRSEIAHTIDHTLARVSAVFGVDRYISLDRYCVEDDCDFIALRQEIESVLTTHT